jgi:hypothetical protein
MKRQHIINDQIVIKEKKWCPFGKHWRDSTHFGPSQSYCKKCLALYREDLKNRKRVASIEKVTKRVIALEQLLTDILTCKACASRGYIVNHEKKVFLCDCRILAKQKVAAIKHRS